MNSSFLQLKSSDFVKGLVVAVLTPVLGALSTALNGMGVSIFASFDFYSLVKIGALAGIGYVVKNLFSTQDGKFLGSIG